MKKYWPRILMFVFVFFFLFTDNPLRKTVFGPTEVHKTVYVNNSFDDDDFVLIQEAAKEWETETHGLATINVVKGYDDYLYKHIAHDQSSLVMMRAGIWNPLVTLLDTELKAPVLGYFFGNEDTQSILLVPGRMKGNDYYRSVIVHEMGHAFALSHIDAENTVMTAYMSDDSFHLTKMDIDWFCRVYYCDASKLGGI